MPNVALDFKTTISGDTPVSAANPLPVTLTQSADSTTFPVKYARINATADGVNTIVAAVASKKIRVISYAMVINAQGTITIQDDAGTPNVLASFTLAQYGGVSFSGGPSAPAFETAVGEGLTISNGAGVDTLGHLAYIEV